MSERVARQLKIRVQGQEWYERLADYCGVSRDIAGYAYEADKPRFGQIRV